MDREAVEVHEVPKGELGPGGEQQGRQGSGDADAVEEVPHRLGGLDGKEKDEEYVHTAQVKGQVGVGEKSQEGEPGDLPDLVSHHKSGQDPAHTGPSLLPQLTVEETAEDRQGRAEGQPE